jgi:hypothetical protein
MRLPGTSRNRQGAAGRARRPLQVDFSVNVERLRAFVRDMDVWIESGLELGRGDWVATTSSAT